MEILAIDPGETESHYVIWNGKQVSEAWSGSNEALLEILRKKAENMRHLFVVVEGFNARGQRLGQDSVNTIEWYARFFQCVQGAAGKAACSIVRRNAVKKHLLGQINGDNTAIRMVLLDRFGPKPTKVKPNKVYGDIKLKDHQWQAFALAVTVLDRMQAVDAQLEE
jgi:hypothetical protein